MNKCSGSVHLAERGCARQGGQQAREELERQEFALVAGRQQISLRHSAPQRLHLPCDRRAACAQLAVLSSRVLGASRTRRLSKWAHKLCGA